MELRLNSGVVFEYFIAIGRTGKIIIKVCLVPSLY